MLNEANPYYYKSLAYMVYWWLAQKFPENKIDTLFFLWEIEHHFSSIQRPQIVSPVMTLIGSNWCIFLGPNWHDGDTINVLWYGPDILDCLVQYLYFLHTNGWKVYDRENEQLCELKGGPLETMMRDINFDLIRTEEEPPELSP